MKCQCRWVSAEANWEATPDDNEAIGMAVCYDPLTFGEKGSEPFPICEKHAERRGKHWKIIPLPDVEMKDSHSLVWRDQYFVPITDVVIAAIRKSFSKDDVEDIRTGILAQVQWDHLNGCYYFNRWGMYVGVERDGHIHT